MAGSRVSFKEVSVVESSNQYISDSVASDHSSSDSDANDLYEITTESLSTSEEEDAERLQ